MNSQRSRFFAQVAMVMASLIVVAGLFVVVRVGQARNIVRTSTEEANSSLAGATAVLSSPDPEQTGEQRVQSARELLQRGAAALVRAASASATYDALADSPLPLVRWLTRSLEPRLGVATSIGAAVATLGDRVAWRSDALAALRKLKGYDASADIGTVSPRQDTRELIRRLYFAKDGMARVSTALDAPPTAAESGMVAPAVAALNAARATIDPLIVALDGRRWGRIQSLIERYLVAAAAAQRQASTAYDRLADADSIAAMAVEFAR